MTEKYFYGWWIVAGMFAAMFLSGGAGFYVFGILYAPLMAEFAWSRADIAATVTIYLAAHGFVSPLVGRLTDRFGSRYIVLAGAFLAGAGFFSLYFTRSIVQFYLTYALIGIAMAGCAAIPVNAILNNWFIRKRGLAIGIAATGISAGAMILTNITAYIIDLSNWRYAFVFLGLSAWLLVMPIVYFAVRDYPWQKGLRPLGATNTETELQGQGKANSRFSGDQDRSLQSILRNPTVWLLAISFLTIYANVFAVIQHQVSYLSDIGISAMMAASALGVTGGMGGFGKIVFGIASDRYNTHKVMIVNCLIQGIGVFILLNTSSAAQIWLFAVVFGFGMGGQASLQPILIGEVTGTRHFGTVMGLVSLMVAIGGGLSPFIAGLVRDLTGTYEPVLYGCITLTAISALAITLADRQGQRQARYEVALSLSKN